jgi:hypothetical protein
MSVLVKPTQDVEGINNAREKSLDKRNLEMSTTHGLDSGSGKIIVIFPLQIPTGSVVGCGVCTMEPTHIHKLNINPLMIPLIAP